MPNRQCLFFMEAQPITPNAKGGTAPLFYSHLELLASTGCEINLIILAHPQRLREFNDFIRDQPDVWDTVRGWCASHHIIQIRPIKKESAPLKHFVEALVNPLNAQANIDESTLASLQQVIVDKEPQFIWAEDYFPATLMMRFIKDYPIIYSHNDWKWRIKKHRAGRQADHWRAGLKFWLRKRHERILVRRVAGCVSASATEAKEICDLGVKRVEYFPTTYAPIDLPDASVPSSPPRIVHLGGMQTTANRLGLQRFLEVTWPIICQNLTILPELWIIGSLSGATNSLLTKLEKVGAVRTGFVDNLSSVLRPYDIHIIPWEHNTGTRTRIPLILNYAQVLVSTKAAAACLPELKHNENSVLVDSLTHMAQHILMLLPDDVTRHRIGQAGRLTFLNHFTREAIQSRFDIFVDNFTRR